MAASDRIDVYVYPPVHRRLVELQRRMVEEGGGQPVSLGQVIGWLLDVAAEREESGA